MVFKNEQVLEVSTRDELRKWLLENSTVATSCWVPVTVKATNGFISYLDLVEEVLCFGWIDGTKKKNAEGKLMQRISPRKKSSSWTELNKERVRRLEALGLMTEHGRKVLPNMCESTFQIDEDIMHIILGDKSLHENFLNLPKLYTRIRIDNIQSYRHDKELFTSRLNKFIEQTKINKMYGQWDDDGKLSEYINNKK